MPITIRVPVAFFTPDLPADVQSVSLSLQQFMLATGFDWTPHGAHQNRDEYYIGALSVVLNKMLEDASLIPIARKPDSSLAKPSASPGMVELQITDLLLTQDKELTQEELVRRVGEFNAKRFGALISISAEGSIKVGEAFEAICKVLCQAGKKVNYKTRGVGDVMVETVSSSVVLAEAESSPVDPSSPPPRPPVEMFGNPFILDFLIEELARVDVKAAARDQAREWLERCQQEVDSIRMDLEGNGIGIIAAPPASEEAGKRSGCTGGGCLPWMSHKTGIPGWKLLTGMIDATLMGLGATAGYFCGDQKIDTTIDPGALRDPDSPTTILANSVKKIAGDIASRLGLVGGVAFGTTGSLIGLGAGLMFYTWIKRRRGVLRDEELKHFVHELSHHFYQLCEDDANEGTSVARYVLEAIRGDTRLIDTFHEAHNGILGNPDLAAFMLTGLILGVQGTSVLDRNKVTRDWFTGITRHEKNQAAIGVREVTLEGRRLALKILSKQPPELVARTIKTIVANGENIAVDTSPEGIGSLIYEILARTGVNNGVRVNKMNRKIEKIKQRMGKYMEESAAVLSVRRDDGEGGAAPINSSIAGPSGEPRASGRFHEEVRVLNRMETAETARLRAVVAALSDAEEQAKLLYYLGESISNMSLRRDVNQVLLLSQYRNVVKEILPPKGVSESAEEGQRKCDIVKRVVVLSLVKHRENGAEAALPLHLRILIENIPQVAAVDLSRALADSEIDLELTKACIVGHLSGIRTRFFPSRFADQVMLRSVRFRLFSLVHDYAYQPLLAVPMPSVALLRRVDDGTGVGSLSDGDVSGAGSASAERSVVVPRSGAARLVASYFEKSILPTGDRELIYEALRNSHVLTVQEVTNAIVVGRREAVDMSNIRRMIDNDIIFQLFTPATSANASLFEERYRTLMRAIGEGANVLHSGGAAGERAPLLDDRQQLAGEDLKLARRISHAYCCYLCAAMPGTYTSGESAVADNSLSVTILVSLGFPPNVGEIMLISSRSVTYFSEGILPQRSTVASSATVGPDAGVESGADAGPEAGTESDADTRSGADAGPEADTESEAGTGSDANAGPDADVRSDADSVSAP